jgi:hypothetical protein
MKKVKKLHRLTVLKERFQMLWYLNHTYYVKLHNFWFSIYPLTVGFAHGISDVFTCF